MNLMVRKERLELSRLTALEPKSSASTNSATLALGIRNDIILKWMKLKRGYYKARTTLCNPQISH